MAADDARRTIEEALDQHAATAALNTLVRWNCARDLVIAHLVHIRFVDPRLHDLRFWAGRSRRQMQADRRHILKTATLVESFLDRPLIAVDGVPGTGRSTRMVALSADLKWFADLLQEVLDEVSGRKQLQQEMALAGLVRYVVAQTGKPHDPEVAELVSAVRSAVRQTVYSVEVHKRWRLQNYPRLAEALSWFESKLGHQL